MITEIKDKTIISWGGDRYFKENIDKLKDISIEYLYAKRECCDACGYKIIDKEDILNIKKPFVIISLAGEENSTASAKWLKEHKIPFTHLSFLINSGFYEGQYIRAVGGEYIDSNNNRIIISPRAKGQITINVREATNAIVRIGEVRITTNKLHIFLMGDKSHLLIGNNTSIGGAAFLINTDGKIEIGEDCMFSHHITISEPDQHMIFDADSGDRINYPKTIKIGRHVWIGREVEILGGAEIGDNSVVGARAVTSGKFSSNVIIAGCPAKVIKENILWAKDSAKTRGIDNIRACKDQVALKLTKNNNGFCLSPPPMVFHEQSSARMDFINPEGLQTDFEWQFISDPDAKLQKPEWFNKKGNGYVLQSDARQIKFILKCIGAGTIEISLRGIWKKNTNGNILPIWIDYTYFSINQKTIIDKRTSVWHNKPYKFRMAVNDGDIIECHAKWEEHID